MSIIACAGSDEGPGANFTPPTLGEFMKNQETQLRRLREARVGASVVREARLFHEKQAQKHGLHTKRGIAHLRAARMFSREAGASLQERLESFNNQVGEIDPNTLAKATKDTINFHKKMAQKHGLDSDLGHAHTSAMEHHMDTLQQLKKGAGQPQQPPQQVSGEEAYEGGPGSGPKKSGFDDKKRTWTSPEGKTVGMDKKPGKYPKYHEREALPGKSGKQLPVPVPNKSQMPSQDIKQDKPPIDLDAQQGGGQRLQQTYGAHAGMRASKKPTFESRFRRFEREARGPYDGECALPTSVKKQVGKDLVDEGPRVKREARRSLRRRRTG